MTRIKPPIYGGRSLVNLMAELEARWSGTSESPRLANDLRAKIPEGRSTVLVLFDGLGSHQLRHPNAIELAADHTDDLDAPFPTTTTVSLATVATALPPSKHGLIAYQLWLPNIGKIVNTIHMTTMWGDRIDQDHVSFLPKFNLWERLTHAGVDVTTVQPDHFDRTPLSLALYRGASFAPYRTLHDAAEQVVELAQAPGRLIFLYVPHIDFAAHVAGQTSQDYSTAVAAANNLWTRLVSDVPTETVLIGTADHGHVDIQEANKVRLSKDQEQGRTLYGDPRAVFVKGDGASLATQLPAEWVPFADIADLWGAQPYHESFEERRPDGILFAHDGYALFHRRSNDRLVGHHGGLSDEERVIPLLVRT